MHRSPYLVAALALALLLPSRSVAPVDAASVAVVEIVGAATPLQPAVRLAQIGPANFPMEPSPRCDVLDNFGDPRSGGRTHMGSDMLATLGQDVYAMADGTLVHQVRVGDGSSGSSLSGNLWKLARADGTYYTYAHLSGFAPGLQVGSKVTAGQVIGYVGDTGNPGAGNYHLHFEIHPGGGAAVNPLPLLTIPPGCRVY